MEHQRLILTLAMWLAWCVLHSALNEDGPTGAALGEKPLFKGRYRLFYNIFAVISLTAGILLTPRYNEVSIVEWTWPWNIVQIIGFTISGVIFAMSFKQLDLWEFLGLRSSKEGNYTLQVSEPLVTDGVYGYIRHPQFSAGILALWVRDLVDTALVINTVLTVYMIFGAKVEEKRLIDKYQGQYKDYMRDVPGFIPIGAVLKAFGRMAKRSGS